MSTFAGRSIVRLIPSPLTVSVIGRGVWLKRQRRIAATKAGTYCLKVAKVMTLAVKLTPSMATAIPLRSRNPS